jgi:ribonuclease T1
MARPSVRSKSTLVVVAIVALVVGVMLTLLFKKGSSATTSTAQPDMNQAAPGPSDGSGKSSSTTSRGTTTKPTKPDGRFATIKSSELPPEGRTTLKLIASDGPFPFPKNDGVVFSNFEGILPKQPKGYYHEYTVITPGAPTRGTRRIITGKDGTKYYTNDHYTSFKVIVDA